MVNITENKTSVNAKKVYKRKKLTFFSDDLLAAIKKKVISPCREGIKRKAPLARGERINYSLNDIHNGVHNVSK